VRVGSPTSRGTFYCGGSKPAKLSRFFEDAQVRFVPGLEPVPFVILNPAVPGFPCPPSESTPFLKSPRFFLSSFWPQEVFFHTSRFVGISPRLSSSGQGSEDHSFFFQVKEGPLPQNISFFPLFMQHFDPAAIHASFFVSPTTRDTIKCRCIFFWDLQRRCFTPPLMNPFPLA